MEIMAEILGGMKSFFLALWKFCTTKPGCYIAMAGLVALAIWWSGQRGYDRGASDAKIACEAAHAAAARQETARQVKAGIAATGNSEARTTRSEVKNTANKEIVAHVKSEAERLPPAPAACPLAVPAALADELRELR